MNRRRITAIASIFTPVAVGLAFGLVAMNGAAASARDEARTINVTTRTVTTTAVTASGPRYVTLDCNSKSEVQPSQYVMACGDGNAALAGLHWTSWTPQLASGHGDYYLNDCRPYCAAGHIHKYPALVVLWGSGSVQGHPAERRYTQVTLVFPGTRPPLYQLVNGKGVTTYPVSQTWPLWP